MNKTGSLNFWVKIVIKEVKIIIYKCSTKGIGDKKVRF